jgi:opacity protein-like surface antigen
MKKLLILALVLLTTAAYSQSIDAQLVVTRNDEVVDGSLQVAITVKGNSLGVPNTLNSATFDIEFDTTKLFTPTTLAGVAGITQWNTGITSAAYSRSASRIINSGVTYLRLGPAGNNVNANFDGTPAGWDIPATYDTVAKVTFKIKDAATTTDISVRVATYACKVFSTHNNEDGSGGFLSPTLNPVTNLTGVSLPVQLSSFAAAMDYRNARLSWSTATETNNHGFEIERRAVGGNGAWAKVGFVAGAGTSTSPREYSYVDANVRPGRYAYQLKQIDTDGKYSYSGSVEIEVGAAAREFALTEAFPNPFNPATTIEFSVPNDGHATLKVFNVLGQEVATLFNGIATAGRFNQARFDASSLPTGLYFSRLEFDGKSMMKKLMLTK